MAIIIRRREFTTPIGDAAAWLTDAPVQKLVKVLRLALLAMLVLLAVPLMSEGQQPNAIPHLCFLTLEPGTLEKRSPRFDAFFQSLRDLGYEDGKSIIIDYLSAEDHGERFPALVAECLRRKADVIVPSTTPAAQVAKNATQTIPIVMIALGDPLGTGLVKNLAHPGGNITGMAQMVPELAVKRLELLKEAAPRISQVLVLTYLVDPIAPLQVMTMKEAAPRLGVSLLVHDIQTADDIPVAFDAAVKEGADGLIVTAESIFVTYRARVSELAAQHRLPAMYPYVIELDAAGAHYVVPDFAWVQDVGGSLMVLADQIRRAIAWVYDNAVRFGGDPNRLYIGGQSSGGHLAAVALTTDWPRDFGLPADIIKGGMCISGMYDLTPVRLSARNAYVAFDDATVAALSPVRHLDRLHAPLVVAYGTCETPEFQRQNREFAAAVKAAEKPVQLLVGENYNHFELPETLSNPYGLLGQAALDLMGLTAGVWR